MSLLALNVGSSSLKAACYRRGESQAVFVLDVDLATGAAQACAGLPESRRQWPPGLSAADIALRLVSWLRESGEHGLTACVHRVVHGGERDAPVLINAGVLRDLHRLAPLCPLHQPPALAVVDALRKSCPDLVQIAAFDTAFHAGQPSLWREYALPAELRERGVRGYGFHGLSCQSIMRRIRHDCAELADGRVIIAHLGNGSSLTAVRGGRSQATTMGFSALDGLPMGTRCGHLDPGVLLYLLEQDWTVEALTRMLYRQSGLLGLSGISGDMRTLTASDAPEAAFAIDFYIDRVAREIAGLATVLGGLDLLVFTGGIGEHQPAVRAGIVRRLAWMGLKLDEQANRDNCGEIAVAESAASLRVIATDEQDELRRAAEAVLLFGD